METETLCVKLDKAFARDIDRYMQKHRYTTKTELVREALREKMKKSDVEEALQRLDMLYGASKRRTTDKQLHDVREKIAQELGL